MAWIPGKFVWFEHVSNDVDKALGYYQSLFGWTVESMKMGNDTYHMLKNGSDTQAGLRSGPPGTPNHWLSWVSTTDVDATVTTATKAGAKVVMPASDWPIGRGAAIADPQGAVIALWKSKDGDVPDVERSAPGSFCWNELVTTDIKAALQFYKGVFGYTDESMAMAAGHGTYYLLKKEAAMRAGAMQCPMPNMPAHWLPYVAVADCDAAAGKAKTLGAQIVVPPTDIPNIGRFAVTVDPFGAALGLFKM